MVVPLPNEELEMSIPKEELEVTTVLVPLPSEVLEVSTYCVSTTTQ